MLNSIILMGRLTRDPELRHTQNDIPVASFTLACNRDFGKKDEADFIDIVAWRQTGEFASTYFKKGQLVAVQGRLQSRKWDDKDGKKRTAYEIIADRVHFAEGKKDREDMPYQSGALAAGAESFGDPTAFEDDGDLPF